MTEISMKQLHAEIETIRAKNDALLIAIKYLCSTHPERDALLKKIISSLRILGNEALFSGDTSDIYRGSMEQTANRIDEWMNPKS